MTEITKPTNLLELVASQAGLSQEQLAKDLKSTETEMVLNFNDDASKIDLSKRERHEFTNGDYSLKDYKDIQKGAEILGQQLIDHAAKLGMKITDLKEFKDADFNKDGKVDAKEVGALLLGASMLESTSARMYQNGDLVSTFDNQLTTREMKGLSNPKAAGVAKAIATQILQDSGVKVSDPKTDAQFVTTVKEIQTQKTTPAEAVKAGGLVEGAKMELLATAVSDRTDGKDAALIRGSAEFIIAKNKDGKLIANLAENDKQHLVPRPDIDGDKVTERATQVITATLKVDGEKPKQVTFEVAKDGTLTEKAGPAATPQGAAKSAGAQR